MEVNLTRSRNPHHRHADDGQAPPRSRHSLHPRQDCPQWQYLEKQAIWFLWQRARLGPDYDIPDSQFWERFNELPACACNGRPRVAQLVDRPTARQRGGFQLSFGPVSVWTWRSMRARLRRMLAKELRIQVDHWDLEQLVPAAGRTPTRVIAALRQFESRRR